MSPPAHDPIGKFEEWLADATATGIHEPTAMVLATAGADGAPSARMVLLKGVDDRGFCQCSSPLGTIHPGTMARWGSPSI